MNDTPAGSDDLNFDRAESSAGKDSARRCANCGAPLGQTYYAANGTPVCESCQSKLISAVAPVSEPAVLAKATVFGLAAAAMGAAVYYAVWVQWGWQLSLITVLTGWLVGQAMLRATGSRGGRTLQVIAAALVYLSVAMAYLAIVLPASAGGSLVSVVAASLLMPVGAILGSGVSGIIVAAIIGFGMAQAWQLMATPKIVFEGPFKLADQDPPST